MKLRGIFAVVAVIVADPDPTAVIFPLLLTFATDVLLEAHVTEAFLSPFTTSLITDSPPAISSSL